MSLTSYRAAPPRANCAASGVSNKASEASSSERYGVFLTRFGGDLLSHVLGRSTIGATVLNGRVRDGIGCFTRAVTTKPRKEHVQVKRVLLIKPVFYWIKSSLSGN